MLDEIIKIAFVIAVSPIWWPFAKAMWQELQDLFAEEGGLFGEDPGARKRAAIRAERESRPSPLVHEWIAFSRAGGAPAPTGPPNARARSEATSSPLAARAPNARSRARSFRR